MRISKGYLSVGLATALLMCGLAMTFGTVQATTVKQGSMTETTTGTTASTARKKRQPIAAHRRQRYSATTLKTSAKRTKRVPKAKSLSKESY